MALGANFWTIDSTITFSASEQIGLSVIFIFDNNSGFISKSKNDDLNKLISGEYKLGFTKVEVKKKEVLKDNSNNYDLNVNINYYLTTEYNLYVHKHETSSIKRFFKIEKNEYEDEEVEVA